jgi:hypothetical protein
MARLVGILRRGVSSIRGRLGGGLYDRRSTACKQSILHVSSMLKSTRFTVDMGLLCVVTTAVVVRYPAFLRPTTTILTTFSSTLHLVASFVNMRCDKLTGAVGHGHPYLLHAHACLGAGQPQKCGQSHLVMGACGSGDAHEERSVPRVDHG